MQENKTNGFGEVYFSFDYWRDGIPVDSSNIERMDFFFPHTERVIRMGAKINFQPLWIRDVNLKNIREGINITLPFSIAWYEYDIGYGPFEYCFAVMPDMHIADGKKTQLHYIGGEPVYLEDFGSAGYDDTDNDPNETTFAIQNNENIVAKVNQLIGPGYNYPIKFVVCLGDITKSSERSEYERAKKILRNLQVPWIPVFGNHDTWPYIGRRWSYIEQSASSVTIGEYFYNAFAQQYDSLEKFLPIPNWKESPLLSNPTSITGQGYPSYYTNFTFDYQNYHFIGTDWNTRCKAVYGWPGTNRFATVDKGQPYDYTWDWLHNEVTSQKKIAVLAHHPCKVYWNYCFSGAELHEISQAGLKNNHPIARWIGGHLHGAGDDVETTYVNSDTIAIIYNLAASEDGYLYIIRIRDDVMASIYHYPSEFPLPVTVEFQPGYSYVGGGNNSQYYYWDFGDGSGCYDYPNTPGEIHIYHLYNNLDTLFKVTLTATTVNGRKVSIAKVIKVTASPYNFHTVYVKEDSVKLAWNFDQPDKVQYYIVKRNGVDIGHPTANEFIDTQNNGLQRGQTYNYEVSVHYKSGVGHSDSPAAKLYGVQVPWVDAPTVRQPVDLPPNQVRISWHNNSNYTINYTIARWDTIHGWQNSYKPDWNDTLLTDTVSFLYKYRYKVKAKDAQGHYSDWSKEVEYSSGMLAQSNYSKMSAYNNGAKVFKIWNNVQKSTFFRQAENVDFCWDSPPTFVL